MIDFQGAAALVTHTGGGQFSKAKIKALTETSIKRIKAFVAALSAAILCNPVLTESAKLHTADYMETIKKQADDPTHTVSTDGRILSGADIGYLTYIGGAMGLTISWLCRHPECGWFGENHMWYKALSEHFCCPLCLREYRPWAYWLNDRKTKAAFPAQKMVSYTNMNGVTKDWPMEWPDSAGDKWLNGLIEDAAAAAGTIDETNLVPFMQRNIEEIDKLVPKMSRPAQFQHMAANPNITEKGDRWPEANYGHILKNGVYGAYAKLEPSLEVFKDVNELIALFANVLRAGKQMAKL
jgi:hypothetical protein